MSADFSTDTHALPTAAGQLELDGRTALVTGAGRGIGAATSALLSRRGAAVVLADRDEPAVRRVAAALEAQGAQVRAVGADMAGDEGPAEAVRCAVETFGSLDTLVVNHSIHASGSALETSIAEWEITLEVNLTGAFRCVRAALPAMLDAGRGAIVGVSSDCAVRSCRDAAAYVTTKAGLVALIRSVAADFGPRNVRANVVTPGVTDTPLLRQAYSEGRDLEDSLERAAKQSLLGRIGRPEDVAEAIAFLCGDRAEFITGAELIVDGGMTVNYAAD